RAPAGRGQAAPGRARRQRQRRGHPAAGRRWMTAARADPKAITRQSEDFDRWYVDTVLRAELADYAPVKGCMVIRPYGLALWENVYLGKKRKLILLRTAEVLW